MRESPERISERTRVFQTMLADDFRLTEGFVTLRGYANDFCLKSLREGIGVGFGETDFMIDSIWRMARRQAGEETELPHV